MHLSVDLQARRLVVDQPILPAFLTYLKFDNLELPFGTVDLLLERRPNSEVQATALRQSGDFQLQVSE